MNWNIFIIGSSVLFLFLCAILLSKIKVKVCFKMKNLSECTLNIRVIAVYGIIRIKRSIDVKEKLNNLINDEGKPAEALDQWQQKFEGTMNESMMKDLKDPILEALKNLDIHCFKWRSGAGTGNAAVTGRLAGAAWTVKGIIEAWIKRYIPMKNDPELTFVPFFQSTGFETELSCMVSIRQGKAILTIIGLYKKWKKLKNRRIEYNGTSNQRINDDSDGKPQGNDRCEYDRWRSG